MLIYISFIWIQEESYTLHGINGPGRHQAERGAHTPTGLVCLFKLQMTGDGVFVCEGPWIWRRFCVKLQVLVHFTHIYTLSMLFTVRLFLTDSFCFIHRRSSVWDVPEMDQSTGLEGSYICTPNLLALELNPSLSLLIFLTYKKLRHCGNCQARSDPHMENSPSATQRHWLEPFQISTVKQAASD